LVRRSRNGRSARAAPRARRGARRAPLPTASNARAAEHAGVQELEQRPQLAEVVLDRRAAQRQAVLALAAARTPWRVCAVGVLDRLRLVEHDQSKRWHLRERLDSMSRCAACRRS
jgi:hypothetical protein